MGKYWKSNSIFSIIILGICIIAAIKTGTIFLIPLIVLGLFFSSFSYMKHVNKNKKKLREDEINEKFEKILQERKTNQKKFTILES